MSVQPVKPASPIRLLYEELPKVYVFSARKIFTTFCGSFPNRIFRSIDKGFQGFLWFRTRILENVARSIHNILGISFLFFLLRLYNLYDIFCDMMTNVFLILATGDLLKYSFLKKFGPP